MFIPLANFGRVGGFRQGNQHQNQHQGADALFSPTGAFLRWGHYRIGGPPRNKRAVNILRTSLRTPLVVSGWGDAGTGSERQEDCQKSKKTTALRSAPKSTTGSTPGNKSEEAPGSTPYLYKYLQTTSGVFTWTVDVHSGVTTRLASFCTLFPTIFAAFRRSAARRA